MGLTMVEELGRRLPGAQFKFVVHRHRFEMERKWAERFGIEIVPRLPYPARYLLALNKVTRLFGIKPKDYKLKLAQYREYVAAMKEADVILNNEGISYVGDGVRRWKVAIYEHSGFQYAKALRRPYCRFIQSYGPFDDWRVRWFARRELSTLPLVLARGSSCAKACKTILPEDKVRCVPDCAVLLQACDDETGEKLLPEGYSRGGYSILSPSAVIRHSVRKDVSGSIGQRHVDSFVELAKAMLGWGRRILFLPHMYSDIAGECDREVCREIIAALPKSADIQLVEEDIGPREAKWLIANSEGCVVSRYHALVAAISTATPVVTIGWNVKYRDLLEFYDAADMAVDARQFGPAELAIEVLRKLDSFDDALLERVAAAHGRTAAAVGEAIDELTYWMESLQER